MSLINYEDTLTSYIQDDDKLVTYKWLSNKLKIHVNVSKNILKQYWDKYRKNKMIVATFLLVGSLHDRSIHIAVVKDSNLNTTRNKFINVDCEHVYSLQKSLNDIELLALTDEGDFYYSAIKYNSNLVKNNEIHSLHYTGYIKDDSSYYLFKNVIKNENIKKVMFEEKNSNKAKIPIQLSKSEFNDLIGNKLQISNIGQDSSSDEWKNSEHSFDTESEVAKIENLKLNVKKDNMIRIEKDVTNLQFKNKIRIISKNELVTRQFSTTNIQGGEQNFIKKNELSKRKRIILDSSKDEFINNNGKEENKQIEQVLKVIRNKSPIIQLELKDNKHIIKKTTDKTFKDEDGYLVTKRIHIYEDVNDNDKYIKVKNQESHKPKSVKIIARKQTTLTNFFKKS